MNDQQLKNKVHQDTARVKKDLNTLVEDGVSQLSAGIEKLTNGTREAIVDTTAMVKKNVGHGLSQYNAKTQKVADKVPGGFGKKAVRYPWVAISIALVVGFLLGGLLKPARQSLG